MPADLENLIHLHRHTGADLSQRIQPDWELLNRFALSGAATAITVLNVPSRTFLKVFIEHGAKSGVSNNFLRFNNDSASNYTFIDAGVTARTSRTEIDLIDAANNSLGYFYVLDIVNVPSLVKEVRADSVARITSAGTAQSFNRILGTWVNTTAYINRIDLISSNTQTFPSASSITIYGSNQ